MLQSFRYQRDRASRIGLYILFGLLPLVAVLGHRGLAPWVLLAAIPAFLRGDFWQSAYGKLFDSSDLKDPFFTALVMSVGFCGWVFLSGFWSPHQEPSLAFNILAPILVGGAVIWFLLHQVLIWSHRYALAFVYAVLAGLLLLLFEGLTNGALRGFLPPEEQTARDVISLSRGVTVFVPAIFPAAAIAYSLWRNFWAPIALVALGLFAALANQVDANPAAICFGVMMGMATFIAPQGMLRVGLWGLIVVIVLAPAVAFVSVEDVFTRFGEELPSSWLHRVAIWQAAAERIPEGLPFGFGADFSREWKETAEMIFLPGAVNAVSVMPVHPHNAFLQVWLELGVPGVIAIIAVLYFIERHMSTTNLPVSVIVGFIGALAAITVSFWVEASIWQVWRLAAIVLAGMGVALAYTLHQKR